MSTSYMLPCTRAQSLRTYMHDSHRALLQQYRDRVGTVASTSVVLRVLSLARGVWLSLWKATQMKVQTRMSPKRRPRPRPPRPPAPPAPRPLRAMTRPERPHRTRQSHISMPRQHKVKDKRNPAINPHCTLYGNTDATDRDV